MVTGEQFSEGQNWPLTSPMTSIRKSSKLIFGSRACRSASASSRVGSPPRAADAIFSADSVFGEPPDPDPGRRLVSLDGIGKGRPATPVARSGHRVPTLRPECCPDEDDSAIVRQ